MNFVANEASKKIKQGNFSFQYDFDKVGAKDVGHSTSTGIPDLRKPEKTFKFFLGAAEIVRHGSKVYIADEYDYNYNLDLRDQGIFDKIGGIFQQYQRFAKGEVGAFAVVDSILERFQSKPGEGMSVRLELGTAESMGLTAEEFDKISTLDSYEEKNKTINPRNKGWRPTES